MSRPWGAQLGCPERGRVPETPVPARGVMPRERAGADRLGLRTAAVRQHRIRPGVLSLPPAWPHACVLPHARRDQLNALRREKQKLVEKIMDQYRVLEPGPLPRIK